MKTIITALILFVSSFAMAQNVDEPKELTPPKGSTYPEVGNLHEVEEVAFPRNTPMLKERKVAPESTVVPPDQGYQTPCQNGDVTRCSGVDMSTFESNIRVPKPEMSKITKPVVNIKIIAEVEERRSSPRKRQYKRR